MRIRAICAVLALTCTVPVSPANAAEPPQRTVDEVTLVTGDRVSVDPGGNVTAIKPGAGRDDITFRTHRGPDGHTVVIPQDAIEPLTKDRVDRRLFDITALLEFGYRDRMPLIVNRSARAGARTANDWSTLKHSNEKVWLDGIRKPSLDRSVAQIGAPAAHRRGLDGEGIKVAILDTGVNQNHPDLLGQEIAERNFTTDPDNTDNDGHGTHVGSTVASQDSTYRGVAPGARLLDAKVCIKDGCSDSWIINGMRWAVEQGAEIVNVSLGSPDSPEIDPLEQEINDLTARYGTLFVVGAGNDGPSGESGTITSPGSAEAALTVGAVDRQDKLADSSSQGPKKGARGTIKPEVTAPGVDIVAADAKSPGRIALSGTSMAAPHVAGAAALLRQQHPDWTARQLKAALASAAKPAEGLGPFQQGAGRIDVAKAITQPIVADAATIDLGFHRWPHRDSTPTTKALTYTNPTDTAVTLDLEVGSTATGVFSLGAAKLTVPALGTATVQVTGDPRVDSATGLETGEVVATSGPYTVRTLVAIDREPESYELTLDHTRRTGADQDLPGSTRITGLDVPVTKIVDARTDPTVRLPKGTYLLDSTMLGWNDSGDDLLTSQLVHPALRLDGDQTLKIDAREVRPVSVTAPEPISRSPLLTVDYRRTFNGVVVAGTVTSRRRLILTAQLGSPLPDHEFSSLVSAHSTTAADPATSFRLAYQVPGFPTGFTRAPLREELARVETTFDGITPGTSTSKSQSPRTALGIPGGEVSYPLPEGRTAVEFVTTENVRWQSSVSRSYPNGASVLLSSPYRTYEAGRAYREHEVRPVFSPGLPDTGVAFARRTGAAMEINTRLLGDGNHGTGLSWADSMRTALYRDGALVGEGEFAGEFRGLPAKEAVYRVEQSLDRGSKFELSTRVSAAWTFRSAATTKAMPLPLSVVRFEPKLSADGAVPAGTLQRLGLVRQSQGDVGEMRDLRVESSFDDGKTWRPAGVNGASALVYHPADAKYASLRATATDSKGNAFELTVIRAYRVAPK